MTMGTLIRFQNRRPPVKWLVSERGATVRTSEGHSEELTIGSVFVERYRIERRIAAGGMGAVYEVVHLETNRRRALKVMHADYVSSDELRARFRQEARVAAEIESEHIVDVFDAGVDAATGMPFLVMELLRGEELGRYSKRTGPLPKEEVVRYLYETSLALDKTHRARIVHRDLKPANLFLCEREHGPPRVKVLDFGIAKVIKDFETKTNTTRPLGTPLYMAPEQFQLTSSIAPATDIFALGMIAFTLLAGKPYWHPESANASEPWAFVIHVATGPKESAVRRAWDEFGVELPAEFDEWFFRVTARDPIARFETAGEAICELARALGVDWPGYEFDKKVARTASAAHVSAPSEQPGPSLSSSIVPPQQRTGPTTLVMTPDDNGASLAEKKRRSRKRIHGLVLGGALVIGLSLGVFVILTTFSRSSTSLLARGMTTARVDTSTASPVAARSTTDELLIAVPATPAPVEVAASAIEVALPVRASTTSTAVRASTVDARSKSKSAAAAHTAPYPPPELSAQPQTNPSTSSKKPRWTRE